MGPLRQRFNSSLQIGSDAPPLTWKDRAGHSVSLANLKGKVVLLHFWANWCVPCLAEMPSLAELDARIANADFSIWAFHVDRVRADNLKNLPLETYPKNIIVDFDRSQLSALDVSAIPVSYLVDREGKIRRVFRGAQNWRSEGLVQLIRSLGKDS
ncbi:MAG: TlpA family protein disulfide reductase [Deltaproteobacteria bacterium]|nr:TlpA family protein disulfide reductase [Deltaproteobacteria bacterium]